MENKERVETPYSDERIGQVIHEAWKDWMGEVDNVPELANTSQRLEFVKSIKKYLTEEGIGLKDRVISGVEFDAWVQMSGDDVEEQV